MGMLRYAEQYLQELPLVLPSGPIDEQAATDLSGRFDAEYVRLYGEGARAVFRAVEMFAVRVAVRIPLGFATTTAAPGARPGATEIVAADTRPVYWPQEHGWVPTAVHDGLELTAQTTVVGPAVIELPHTTVAVATGQRLAPDAIGNLVLTVA
jgi:N-methylhydantoinase A